MLQLLDAIVPFVNRSYAYTIVSLLEGGGMTLLEAMFASKIYLVWTLEKKMKGRDVLPNVPKIYKHKF